jgi:GDP-D-mannose dehydratase
MCLPNKPLDQKSLNKKSSQPNKALQIEPQLTRPSQLEVLVRPWTRQKKELTWKTNQKQKFKPKQIKVKKHKKFTEKQIKRT